jgi:prepilin-type N-terminal cleavage/methylation domain-containing protein/prepilin-type processing-associated H-X9-DG protein
MTRRTARKPDAARAFTLIEVLVSISVIALLLGILLPALGSARETGRGAVCLSNVRQLVAANAAYAEGNGGYYAPASFDIYEGNLERWHGTRETINDPFDAARGPLADYIGYTGAVRACPTFDDRLDHDAPGFEAGNGGYGYNKAYIGGRQDLFGTGPKSAKHTARADDVRRPTETVMFTDAAFYMIVSGDTKLIEYSFAESPRVQQFPGTEPSMWSAPSIHFRHKSNTHSAWADGHVSAEAMDLTNPQFEEFYTALGFGWFGDDSNDLFDLE